MFCVWMCAGERIVLIECVRIGYGCVFVVWTGNCDCDCVSVSVCVECNSARVSDRGDVAQR